MARRISIPSKATQLKIVGPADSYTVARIQRLSMTADRPSTDIDELGNRLKAGTVEDTPAITTTFQTFDVGIKLFSVLTGTDPTAYPASGVSATALTDVDVIVQIKNANTEDFVKMAHARRCVIQDFTFSYSVEGESTEEYTVIGTQKRWFKNDVIVDRFTTGTTSFSLSETPVTLKSGDECLSVILDGIYLEEVAAAPATGEYTVSGTTLTTSDSRTAQCIAVYQAAPTGTNWADINETDVPAAIRGIDVPIEISANSIARIQSITFNGTFSPEAVKEHGNRDYVGYTTQNLSVNGTITVLDTDTELISLFTTGALAPADTEFGISELTADAITLKVELQDPSDTTVPYTILKTLWVPQVSITSEGFTQNVNNNAQQTFDFKSTTGELIVYSGAKP